MAALCTMGNKEDIINRICVAQDEKVGVYGFVFYRGQLFFFMNNGKHMEVG